MPTPNLRGGKSYKKAKGGSNTTENAVAFITKDDDQMVGRIIRMLGDLNVSVFCQDNKTRVCKIAMGIKKKVRFFMGDVVLISLRDCLMSKSELDAGKRSDRGDVLGIYSEAQFSQLKAEGIPEYLFAQTETINKMSTKFQQGDTKGALALGEGATDNYVFEEGDNREERINTVVTQTGDLRPKATDENEEDKDVDVDDL